ncbi:hypothetical protein QQS21_000953 [Conoideocrella luteorostrata]|uniref:Aminoglycoside phosphotransferase domain-containing protein n=1 Tax=Conoideocrella luteorostrata TaxID=1105319 RepID=A0AAJ0D0D6_9HYPO|nr:hypothetical protein QQS21_000953 [Conoideocrella luteorostrata]
MPPITNLMLNATREEDCTGITTERKYFRVDGSFIKRSLRPSEWQHNPFAGTLCIPRFGNERILNEAAALRFIAEKTDIPVPKLYGCFEDDGAVYLIMEYVEGVTMASLKPEQRKCVEEELEGHLKTLRSLKSDVWGGPSGIVIPPYRIMVRSFRPQWRMKARESKDLVFCHNDFSAHNVIVDPVNLRVKAIIDWEYAGYYPQEFEGMFFRRAGPSVALDGEVNDEGRLLEMMHENEEQVN